MAGKKTVIIGASDNPSRYSNIAANMLTEYGHEIVPLGKRAGQTAGKDIITNWPDHVDDLDTVTMYVGPQNQPDLYPYILGLKPKRIIFNPGTENPELSGLAAIQGIETEEACTLVLLRTGQY
ncbi:MAG: CoA-binding protein [Flavobacteriales bacterium]